jgi:mRNA interferase MazF
MTRGDVYWAELRPRSGAEQSGRRPVVVVSSDGFNRVPGWRSVIVVPLSTSESQVRRGPSAVIVEAAQCGLDRDGVALCHQVTTLDRAKLTRRLGALPAEVLREVDDGLHAALDLR